MPGLPPLAPSSADVVAFARRGARTAPDRPAVVHPGGVVTYRELLARLSAVAATLPPAALVPGGAQPVAVVAEHDGAVPELYLGVMAAGHAVVPLSSRLPDAAIAKVVATAGVRRGILAPSAADRRTALVEAAPAVTWTVHGRPETVPVRATSPPPAQPAPGGAVALPPGTAMVCFTSGTTGEPKGVILTHANLVLHGLTAALVYGVRPRNVHVNPMPLAHFAGASRVVLAVVDAGTHVILPGFSPADVFEAIARWRGTHVMVVPTMAAALLDAEPEAHDLGSLETLVYGASPMPMPVARALVERMRCGLVNGYGLTESSALATALGPGQHRAAVESGDEQLLGTVGHAVPGVELRILGDRNQEVPTGEPGQIALRGPKVSPGYLANPEATAARFLPDGWLLTGDHGRLRADDNVELLGRIDEMIITGGLNVQPLEIENEVLLFAGVAECAAFAVPSERWGQEVRLAVVAAPGAAVDPEELRGFLRSRVDRWKVPKEVVLLDRLPRTPVGKIQRFRLAELAGTAGS